MTYRRRFAVKKIILPITFFVSVLIAGAQGPVPVRTVLPTAEEKPRFIAVENTGGEGFYWLDSTTADLWLLDSATLRWVYLGSPRGAHVGRLGLYTALSDGNGGLYILNVQTGEGWRADRTAWQILGQPSRLVRSEE